MVYIKNYKAVLSQGNRTGPECVRYSDAILKLTRGTDWDRKIAVFILKTGTNAQFSESGRPAQVSLMGLKSGRVKIVVFGETCML